MQLNWAERWVVNNPLRVLEQRVEMRRLKVLMPLKPGFVALEVGCGRGAGAGIILNEFKPSFVHAMDVDIGMIRRAKSYLSSRQQHRIVLSTADVSALPVRTNSLDAVFGFGVLHHVVDWRSALAEIARVLKPGGAYFIEELYPSLYQNFITKRILLHPAEDRFASQDFRLALDRVALPLKDAIECKKIGLLGVAVKAS